LVSTGSSRGSHNKLVMKEGGLLSWEGAILSKLEKVNLGCNALKDKQLHAVGYLFKLCYDLVISPHRNVSKIQDLNRYLESFMLMLMSKGSIYV
jgi:hypothetical protein